MTRRITVATLLAAALAAAMLLLEHRPADAGSHAGAAEHSTQLHPSPFARHLKYSRV